MPAFRRFLAGAAAGFRRSALPWVVMVAAAVGGCGTGPDYGRYGGNTMGTYYRVTAKCPGDVADAIDATLEQVNAEMSTYLPDSALSRFNRGPVGEWIEVPAAVTRVVSAAKALSEQSGGAFDVTVGPLVNLWGFGPGDEEPLPTAAEVMETLAGIGNRHLEVRSDPPALRKSVPLYVDLSAIAKGHGVDRVVGRLDAAGCGALLVDIGGEVRGRGEGPAGRPWRIGIEVPDPEVVGAVQRVLALRDAAVATSGDYRNFRDTGGRRISHTIDPRSGYPVDHGLAAVTVVHPSAMLADGYATLLNVLGPQDGLAFARARGLAALFIVRGESGFEERYTGGFEALLVDGTRAPRTSPTS